LEAIAPWLGWTTPAGGDFAVPTGERRIHTALAR
jgi:hypothetical protein